MKRVRGSSFSLGATALWAALFFILCAAPALFPLAKGLSRINNWQPLDGGRLWPLAERSAGLASFSAAAAVFFGGGLALWLVFGKGPFRRAARALYLVPLLLPPYMTALTWMALFTRNGALASFFGGLLGASLSPFGFWGTALVLAAVYAPIVTWMTLESLESLDAGPVEAGMVMGGAFRTWRRGVLPRLLPTAAAGGALVFALCLAEYAVPALLQYNVFSMEIFAEYSRSGDPALAAALALPVAIPALVAAAIAGLSGRLLPSRGAGEGSELKLGRLKAPLELRVLGVLGAGAFLLALAVPLAVLLWQTCAGGRPVDAVTSAFGAIIFSFLLAASSGLLAASLAAPVAWAFHRSGARLIWAFCLIPLALPSPLLGIGLVELAARPWLRWAGNGPWLLLIGHALRFLPVAALVQGDMWRRADPLLWDASRVAPVSSLKRFAILWIPAALPGFALSAALAAAFSLGEIAIALLLCPPGSQTVALRLFNLLHYGADSSVAGLALATMALAAVGGTIIWSLIFWRRRH